MGKLYKESYASTYAAMNVRSALDKLINVLQSPQERRVLAAHLDTAAAKKHVNTTARKQSHLSASQLSFAPAASNSKTTSGFPKDLAARATTPDHDSCRGHNDSDASADGSDSHHNSMASHTRKVGRDMHNRNLPPCSKTPNKKPTPFGSQSSDVFESRDYIPPALNDQVWKKSLRSDTLGCWSRPVLACRGSAAADLEAGWSSVPCKSWTYH